MMFYWRLLGLRIILLIEEHRKDPGKDPKLSITS